MNKHETILDKNYPTRYAGADFILRQAATRLMSLDMTNTKVIFGERHSGRKNYEQEMKKKCLS